MQAPLVQIRELSVRYVPQKGRPVQAVHAVDLDIWKGQVMGILGESGSGKSTLASSLLRLLAKNAEVAGSVFYDGNDLVVASERSLREIRGAKIALIPQDPAVSLNPVIRVGDQVSEVLRAHLKLSRRERSARVRELLHEVGFDDIERIYRAYPHQLSGGQRQRIAIAQAMACRPELILADEPTSKLDPQLQAQIIDLMSQIVRRNGTALLWITHDPTTLAGFADRVAVMYAGKIVEDGPAETVLRNPLHPYTWALMRLAQHADRLSVGAGELRSAQRERLPEIPGELPDLTVSVHRCTFEPRCAQKLQVCSTRHPQAFSLGPSHLVSCFKYGN